MDILPALPEQWDSGCLQNILLRNQIKLVSLDWNISKGKVKIELLSGTDQEITLKLPRKFSVNKAFARGAVIKEDPGSGNSWNLYLSSETNAQIELSLQKKN